VEDETGRPLRGPTVMLTVKLPPERATLDEARKRLGLSEDEIDPKFGLVPLDPAEGTYAVLVSAEAGARAAASAGDRGDAGDVGGPYANPPIEPFGPPDPRPA
jgi:hypothetical protein